MSFTALEIILIIGAGTIGVSVLALVARFSKKSLSITKSGISVSSDKTSDKKSSPHSKCKHSKDVIELFLLQKESLPMIVIEKEIGIFNAQMEHARLKIEEATNLLSKRYLTLLKEVQGSKDGIASSEQFKFYQLILKDVKHEAIDWAEQIMRENHLDSRTEDEFNTYEEEKTMFIMNKVTEILNNNYIPYKKNWPTREQVYDANQDIINQVTSTIKECLRTARRLSIEKNKSISEQIQKIDNHYNSLFKE
jgi:hypothetical protein